MVTSTVANIYAVVRRFGSSSIIGCLEKSSAITKSFEPYSSWFLPVSKWKYLRRNFC